MKSGSMSSYRAAGAMGPQEPDDAPSEAGAAKDTTLTMLYQVCPLCQGVGEFVARTNTDSHEKMRPCVCKTLRVAEVGITAGQMQEVVNRDRLRKEAGITASMLRDGRAGRIMAALPKLRTAIKAHQEFYPSEGGQEHFVHALLETYLNTIEEAMQ